MLNHASVAMYDMLVAQHVIAVVMEPFERYYSSQLSRIIANVAYDTMQGMPAQDLILLTFVTHGYNVLA
jgi:hypothetical protein